MFESFFKRKDREIVREIKKNAPEYKHTYTLVISLKETPNKPYMFTYHSDELYEDVWVAYQAFYDWYMTENTDKHQFNYQQGSRIFLREQITGIGVYCTDTAVEV